VFLMRKMAKIFAGAVALLSSSLACASLVIPVYMTTADGKGVSVGTVVADDTIYGLVLTPDLHGLPPGVHGFHIHDMAMCEHDGTAAGGHFDPDKTNKHLGPYDPGHLGDLPVLIVSEKGRARLPVLAPRLKLEMIKNHALMIHSGGDNYSDSPEKLGGGGARLACGIIPYF
jgi:Cu-Zn family superoxide dismutase